MSLTDDDGASDLSTSNAPFKRSIPTSESFSPSAVLLSMSSPASSNTYTVSSTYIPHNPRPAFSQPPPNPLYERNSPPSDPFRVLRDHQLSTKTAWTVIPAAEGFRILDLCKSMSTAQPGEDRIPCYNRETIFDEEWQAHMKDVHGVFLLWPQTWMRRIEVLDLDAFGGDIGACNEVIMES
jgi:hypothetical protein